MTKEANWGAKGGEAKASTIEVKVALAVSCAVEDFKGSKDFKSEVGKAVYDAYLKGFTKCKAKIFEAFSGLDL